MFLRFPTPDNSGSVPALVAAFLDYAQRVGLYTAAAFESRAHYLHTFAAWIGDKQAAACRKSDLEIFLAEHATRWRSAWTRRSACEAIQRCMRWACDDNRLDRNPFAGVRVPIGDARRPMTDEEFRALLRASDRRFRQILFFLRLTAARPCELRALRWSMVDLERGRATLHKHKASRLQRRPRPRIIRLPPVIVALLRVMQRGRALADPVFVTERGRAWHRVSLPQKLRRLRRKLGIAEDCTLYGARHAFGTAAVVAGVDVSTVAELMGHSTSQTTERYYLHLDREEAHLQAKLEQATRPPRRHATGRRVPAARDRSG